MISSRRSPPVVRAGGQPFPPAIFDPGVERADRARRRRSPAAASKTSTRVRGAARATGRRQAPARSPAHADSAATSTFRTGRARRHIATARRRPTAATGTASASSCAVLSEFTVPAAGGASISARDLGRRRHRRRPEPPQRLDRIIELEVLDALFLELRRRSPRSADRPDRRFRAVVLEAAWLTSGGADRSRAAAAAPCNRDRSAAARAISGSIPPSCTERPDGV